MNIKNTAYILIFTVPVIFSSCKVAENQIPLLSSSPSTSISELIELIPTDIPTDIPTEEVSDPHPLNGLIYKVDEALWQFDIEGEPILLANCAGQSISPDASILASDIEGDIYISQVSDCDSKNITNTPNQAEVNPIFWPNQSDKIAYVIEPSFSGGNIGISDFEGKLLYQSVDKVPNPESYSLSILEDTIAYFDGAIGKIYSLFTTQYNELDPSLYKPRSINVSRMDSPAWSPDGEKIAWVARIENKNPNQEVLLAVLVFDISTQKILNLFSYAPVETGGWPPAPVWSPDGEKLIFISWAESSNEQGFWIASADGKQLTNINIHELADQGRQLLAYPPIWSPNGEWVIVGVFNFKLYNFIINTDNLETSVLDLPIKGVPMIWIDNK